MVNMDGDRSPKRAREDYLKAIYQLGERRAVRAAELARHIGVSRASVSKFKHMLEREGLLEPASSRTGALKLTKKGRELAVRMVRRHRLVETFLHATLHVPLERVHPEAERIEHAISDDISVRLERFLRFPHSDPHGHRIPGSSERRHSETALAAVVPRDRIVVSSVDDRDPGILRLLAGLGVLPGLRATVVAKTSGALRLKSGKDAIAVPLSAAQGVRCRVMQRRRAA
jgi:DtxR family Mn-dependent transcriptional regulator